MASFLLRLFTPTRGVRAAAFTLVLFVIGTALACSFLLGDFGWVGMIAFVSPLTAAAAVCIWPDRFSDRLQRVSRALLVLAHVVWLLALGLLIALLAWSVSVLVWGVVIVLGGLTLAGAVASAPHFRLPAVLPIGVAIAALAAGWMREDGLIRCDDYLRVIASGASVVVPSTPEIGRCRAGESLVVGRYPRRFWEYADASGFLVTTSRGEHYYTMGRQDARVVPDWLSGAVCQVGNARTPDCFGTGKGDGIAESRQGNRLLVLAHERYHATLYALPLHASSNRLAEVGVAVGAGNLFVDDEHDVVGMFEDHAAQLYRVRSRDLSPLAPVTANFAPDQLHYDEGRHEGIACAATGPTRRIDGEAYAAIAFTGAPFTYRPLAASGQYPLSWLAGTFGCDWDPVARRAYVAVASLGLLLELDYDTGEVLKSSFIGFGNRPVTFDPIRRRLFVAFFLSGDVISVDPDSGEIIERWNAGRFVRDLALSRDHRALLASSTLGIVRIPLPAPDSP